MKYFSRNFILILLFFLNIAHTQPVEEKNNDCDTTSTSRYGVALLPVFFYTPETRLGYGGLINFFFREPASSTLSRPSTIMPDIIFTQNKQLILELNSEIYWKDEKYFSQGYIGYIKFPDKFYGIGNDTPEENEEDFTPKFTRFKASFLYRFFPSVYGGISYELENYKIIKLTEGGMLTSGEILGSEGGTTAGIGIQFLLDNRNNIFYPSKGNFLQFFWKIFNSEVGSDYKYHSWLIDLRKYFSFHNIHILAFQGYYNGLSGNIPFHKLALLGGNNMMRGYYQGRFRDKQMIMLQTEYRIHLWWRLGIAVFAGVGDVSDTLRNFNISNFKTSSGIGFRFRVDPQEKLNIRFDWGAGQNTSGIYITIAEAF